MKLPRFVVGPTFSEGDIVSFQFDEAEVQLRVPVVPYNHWSHDIVCRESDFRNPDLSSWDVVGTAGLHEKTLVAQDWSYDYVNPTSLDIAYVYFCLSVLRHSDEEAESLFSMHSQRFHDFLMDDIREDFANKDPKGRDYYPTVENNFFAEVIEFPDLNGLRVKLDMNESVPYPSTCGFFSLGRRYTLNINLRLNSIVYQDVKPPYSEEFLQDLKEQLFDDLLANLTINYTEEAKALIRRLAS